MTVTFIAHSGFLVEWDKFYTLFDFWRGELPPLRPDKPLLVFASHSHEDHFDPRIFRLTHPDTRFFLSHDISVATRRWAKLGMTAEIFARVTSLRADSLFVTEAALEPLTIRTIKSTDAGVAFLLCAEGRLVYHAGDLNDWRWEEEGKAYCGSMAANYRRALEKLAAAVRDVAEDEHLEPVIDAAMAPLDPRLGGAFALGADALLRAVEVRRLFPMHLWEKFEWIDRFCAEYPQYAPRVARITGPGERFEL